MSQRRKSRRRQRSLRRRLLMAGVLAVVSVVGTLTAVQYTLQRTSEKIVWALQHYGSLFGVEDVRPWYRSVSLASWSKIRWTDVGATFTLESSITNNQPVQFLLRIDEVSFQLTRLSTLSGLIVVRAAEFLPLDAGEDFLSAPVDKGDGEASLLSKIQVTSPLFQYPVQIDPRNPSENLRQLVSSLAALSRGGIAQYPVQVEGKIHFPVSSKKLSLTLRSSKVEGGSRLIVDRKDLQKAASLLGNTYTDPEITIVAENPARAPVLISVKDQARTEAKRVHEMNPAVPEDAYRHIYWSYLLTKNFGPQFAELMTDAHEEGLPLSAHEDSLKDYHHNELGRSYFQEGVPEERLVERVLQDSRVQA